MLGDGRTASTKIRGDLAYGQPAMAQELQDLSPGRISNCPEHRIVSTLSNGSHTVTNMVTVWLQMSNR